MPAFRRKAQRKTAGREIPAMRSAPCEGKDMERRISYFKQKGDSYIFAASLGLVISLGMVAWIIFVILSRGLSFFWPGDTVLVKLHNDSAYLGEIWESKTVYRLDAEGDEHEEEQFQMKIGNRDLYGRDFIWLNRADVAQESSPPDAVTIERREYGKFFGFIRAVQIGEERFEQPGAVLFEKAREAHRQATATRGRIKDTQKKLNKLMQPLANLQREITLLQLSPEAKTEKGREKLTELQKEAESREQSIADGYGILNQELERLTLQNRSIILTMATAEGVEKEIYFSEIVRFFRPNTMSGLAKAWLYAGKLWEFVADEPRESNTEGGVFPAIFGTVVMVLLMSIAVVPFGVMAAIYLNEYARQGAMIRFIRLSVNNLAGVPSIVFGVFGLGFFIYAVGGSIDQFFFSDKLPEPTFGTGGILWASFTLALLTLPVVVVATEEGLLAVPRANKEGALALGATRWQMIRKVVLPNALPGILTGLILAISRGAGEVAPLMITGVVKLAPTLAIDGSFPFLHLDRKFMHLGFHIYDVGFQSPNVEAAKPMVYTTALLLIVIVVLLNLVAIYFRNRLRKKYRGSTF